MAECRLLARRVHCGEAAAQAEFKALVASCRYDSGRTLEPLGDCNTISFVGSRDAAVARVSNHHGVS